MWLGMVHVPLGGGSNERGNCPRNSDCKYSNFQLWVHREFIKWNFNIDFGLSYSYFIGRKKLEGKRYHSLPIQTLSPSFEWPFSREKRFSSRKTSNGAWKPLYWPTIRLREIADEQIISTSVSHAEHLFGSFNVFSAPSAEIQVKLAAKQISG